MNNKRMPEPSPAKVSELPNVICPVCGCCYFQQTFVVKKLSHLHLDNPTGRDQFPVHPVFCCMGRVQQEAWYEPCGHIVDLLDPSTFTTVDEVERQMVERNDKSEQQAP